MEKEEKTPLVTVFCMVYNHEPYLRQCLDGFVMQQTTFPFEAIVHDDASTDDSAAIIREYAEKYPDIIKPIYETENQYSKGAASETGKKLDAAINPSSKYIAKCEGDDYWTDPLKLQKQVDFLETHPDFILCSGNYRCYSQEKKQFLFDGKATYDWLFVGNHEYDMYFEYSLDNYFDDWWVRTLTCLFHRRKYGAEINNKGYDSVRDDIIYYYILKQGKGALLRDVLGVYRIHSGGVWSGNNKIDNKRKQIHNAFQIYQIENDKRALKKTRRCTIELLEMLRSMPGKGSMVKEIYAYYKKAPLSDFLHLLWDYFYKKLRIKYYQFVK